jgi:DNA processing protein
MKRVYQAKRKENGDLKELDMADLPRHLQSREAWDNACLMADKQIVESEKNNSVILSPADPFYPSLLRATYDDPFVIYVKGVLPEMVGWRSAAVIGTRQPTEHGRLIADRITRYLSSQKFSIISGLAIGCDTIAHSSAIELGAHTVAVLAHGLHMIAPSQNNSLAKRILSSGGALISEYPYGKPVFPAQFVKRDRTQAGMAEGVIMVQSGIKGGSLHASRAAMDYNRWLAVPCPTKQDQIEFSPNVAANTILCSGSVQDQMDLLRQEDASTLERIIPLRGRQDYFRLAAPDNNSKERGYMYQASLLEILEGTE